MCGFFAVVEGIVGIVIFYFVSFIGLWYVIEYMKLGCLVWYLPERKGWLTIAVTFWIYIMKVPFQEREEYSKLENDSLKEK